MALSPAAQADPSNYGFESVEANASTAQAGGHPDFTVALSLKREPNNELPAATRDVIFELPPGLLPNPTAVPACSLAQFTSTNVEEAVAGTGCPQGSQVGITEVEVFNVGGVQHFNEPVFNIEPRYGEPARLGFFGASFGVLVDSRLRSESDYGGTGIAEGISSLVPLLSAKTELWAVPADESHDAQRITPYEAIHKGGSPDTPNGKRSSGLVPRPFMVNPTQCGISQGVNVTAITYALPDLRYEAFAPLGPNLGCDLLGFSPVLSAAPTTAAAESGSGFDLKLDFPSEGFQDPTLRADAEMKRAEVVLPQGVTVNPSQAAGLDACTRADYARERFDSAPGEGCPEAAKIGTVTAKSPLVEESAEGALFVAKPYENPFGSLVALYMVLKIPDRGVIVKLPVKVELNPVTGQLTGTVDDIPQLPVSSFRLHFRDGARAPLVTPSRCGHYEATGTFTSWAGQTVTTHPGFQIASGTEGAPCPSGAAPFRPGFSAGTLSNSAGSHSPLYMRLSRHDGDQELTRFSVTLPPGLTAKLAGVSQCADSAIAAARAKSGKEEQAAPSCPASSQIGHVVAGAGVGQALTYAEGQIYLAGPYNGAPLSAVAIVPAVAGPFDIGTVVTRQGLKLNPRTGVVTADGTHSDPLPHVLAGIPLKVRDVRVHVDRNQFTLNPTSCDPFQTVAELWGGGSDVFSSADDALSSVAARFQAANCARLGFKPRLDLKLAGGTKRGAHPALRGVYRPRPGEANLAGAVIRLPHSAFLEQAHIRTICTRVQFASDACPKGSIYGRATAVTPLLDQPLSGPIYLRSSSHELPDVVADLHGLVDVEAVARIDSVDGGIRATFTNVPDAPLTKVIISMQGAKKGLIVNSTDLCLGQHRAKASLTAHNSKQLTIHPAMQAACGVNHRRSSNGQ
jgi:hypothetical protein